MQCTYCFFTLKALENTFEFMLVFVINFWLQTFKTYGELPGFNMHEWALAESVVIAALEAAKKEKLKKITEIKVSIGELQQIERDIFKFALNEILKEKGKKIKITFKTEKSTLKCNICGKSWSFDDMKNKLNKDEAESIHFIPEVAFVHTRCPKCGSPDFEITAGRGVSITSIKGKK